MYAGLPNFSAWLFVTILNKNGWLRCYGNCCDYVPKEICPPMTFIFGTCWDNSFSVCDRMVITVSVREQVLFKVTVKIIIFAKYLKGRFFQFVNSIIMFFFDLDD